jgi:hypothetical protein
MQRRYDEAIAAAREALQFSTGPSPRHSALWYTYDMKGMGKSHLEAVMEAN